MANGRNNSGCGCLLAIIIVAGIVSGIRSCTEHLIKGDIKLPKFGSGHVSGGSGGYGTSNGYNVQYNQTTAPNNNSSLKDYTFTNSQPTEYREGKNLQHSNSLSTPAPNSSTINSSNSTSNSTSTTIFDHSNNVTSTQKSKTNYMTCDKCNGTGVIVKEQFCFLGNEDGTPCVICQRSDRHYHDIEYSCSKCLGTGKIKMEIIDAPFGGNGNRGF